MLRHVHVQKVYKNKLKHHSSCFFIFHLRQDFLFGHRSFIHCEVAWKLVKRLDVTVTEDPLSGCLGSDLMIFP